MAMRRLAFLLASIHSGSSTKVWPEIRSTAEKRQCQVFAFPGGRLEAGEEYEYMRNRIYGLAKGGSFDGILCWASSLSGFASEKAVERYLLDRVDLPLVTFGLKIGDCPLVDTDAYSGMRQMVLHLARKHKKTKIAYIGGPRAHSSAEDRYRAYKDALRSCGLKYCDALVRLDCPWTGGARAAASLLDEGGLVPGRDFDALCAASDLLLFEAAALLAARGYSIPGDLALGGFNDSDESNLLSPTYTTVRMPFARQAEQAFSMLHKVLDGERPQDIRLKTRLVIRQSCGCLPESVILAQGAGARSASPAREAKKLGFAEAERERWLGPLESALDGALDPTLGSAVSGSRRGSYLSSLDRALGEAIFRGRELSAFQDYLSALRADRLPLLDQPGRQRLEVLIGQGRVMVSDAEKRMSNYRLWKERALDHWINRLNHELLCAKDFPAVVRAAASCLPRLGIPSGWFVLDEGEGGRKAFLGSFETQGESQAAQHGQSAQPIQAELSISEGEGEAMEGGLFLPSARLPRGAGAFVVLPLHYETRPLGYAVLKAGGAEAPVFEEVRAQLSSAMRGVLLFEQADKARARAEKAERLKAEFLAGITGELQEPVRFIRSAAVRLLSGDEADRREAIKAIASSSSRQMELTKRLLDLSFAQVDDLSFSPRLFDPESLADAFIRKAESAGPERGWPPLLPSRDSAPPPPLLRGDEGRLVQVLEIFMDILGRELGPSPLRLCLSPGAGSFFIGLDPDRGEGCSSLKRLVEGGQPSHAGAARIEIELARRIALLHQASLRCSDSGRLEICLPYPAWEGTASRDRSPSSSRIAHIGQPPPAELASALGAAGLYRIGLGEAAGELGELEECPLVYVDLPSLDAEAWTALDLATERQAFLRCPLFLPATDSGWSRAGREAESPAALGRSLRPPEGPGPILFLGNEGKPHDPLKALESNLLAGGWRILPCSRPRELEALAQRIKPGLLVMSGQRMDFLEILAALPAFAQVPLICVLEAFSDPAFVQALAQRPRTLLINAEPVFSDLTASRARSLLGGESLLPAPTGALVARALCYINVHCHDQVSRWKLSEHINASEDYLSRIFRQQMGIPLWDYLGRLRISRAMELLRASADSVAEIASRCGFQDQAYFCRVFRKVAGTTPGAYRKGSASAAAAAPATTD